MFGDRNMKEYQIKKLYFRNCLRVGQIKEKTGIDTTTIRNILGFSNWNEYHKDRHKRLHKIRNKSGWYSARKKALKRDGCKCVLSEKVSNIVHHIDENPTNNNLDNLVTLDEKYHSGVHSRKDNHYIQKFVVWLRKNAYPNAKIKKHHKCNHVSICLGD